MRDAGLRNDAGLLWLARPVWELAGAGMEATDGITEMTAWKPMRDEGEPRKLQARKRKNKTKKKMRFVC